MTTTYWVVTGFAAFLVAMGLLALLLRRPGGPVDLEGKKLIEFRLFLERRRGLAALGDVLLVALATAWLIAAVSEMVAGSWRGLAYLLTAVLLVLGIWLQRKARLAALALLGDRGRVPLTAAEMRAPAWYRLWGAAVFVGFVGNSLIEFYAEEPFDASDLTSPRNEVHLVLTIVLIVGSLGMFITYLNTRWNEWEA
jgi:hypothetical protein